jgi:prepilin-type processing-associated H-X9-DG protein
MYIGDNDDTFPSNRLPDETHRPKEPCSATAMDYSGLEGSKFTWKRSIMPYVKDRNVFQCPSNLNPWLPFDNGVAGDESNAGWPKSDALPVSYAYNGSYFHEKAVCKEGEFRPRVRHLAEVKQSANLIMQLESRLPYSDLGNWAIPWSPNGNNNIGGMQTHNGACNFVFADGHSARLKVKATCTQKMWLDGQPDPEDYCATNQNFPAEYQ